LLRKAVCGILLILLFMVMFLSAINIKPAKAEWTGTVYIRVDGSIDPPDAPIITYDNVTYTLTDNITSSGDGIIVERDNIIIDGAGYTLKGVGDFEFKGVKLSDITNVTIKNMKIKSFENGIFINCSWKCKIIWNYIKNNKNAIWLQNSYNNTIAKNIVTENNGYSLILDNSSKNKIQENNITRNNGIRLSNSSNNLISGNYIAYNWFGIYLRDSSSDNIIEYNNIKANENWGIVVYSSSNVIIKNNVSDHQGYFPIYSLGLSGSNNTVSGNTIMNNSVGLTIGGNNNTITENKIKLNAGSGITVGGNFNTIFQNIIEDNSGEGISLISSSHNNTISQNIVRSNRLHGIHLGPGYDNSLLLNFVENNRIGIGLYYSSSNNNISRNTVVNSWCGICLSDSSNNNNISMNRIAYNDYGIYLRSSLDNKIYHNNFINNTQQVYDSSRDDPNISPSINIWDDGYPSGGNYWDDHSGVDYYSGPYQNETGSDGIGDTPYVIDEYNVDRYPLMGPFNSFNTSVGCSVDVISNSTIEDFKYFKSNSTIVTHISNMTANQTAGFCRLTIPHELVLPPYIVKVNGTEVEYETIYENYTEGISIIYFAYEHPRLEIMVMPEFPSATTLTLLMLTTLTATILLKNKRKTKAQQIPKFPRTAQHADKS